MSVAGQTLNKIAPLMRGVFTGVRNCVARARLKNDGFSIICPNCIGGILYHRLGKQFLSPTINLYFPDKKDYVKFACNLKSYLQKGLVFIESELPYPVALLDDVEIRFNHYSSPEEAREKWSKRSARVNYDKIYFIADECANFSYEDLLMIEAADFAGRVVFTLNDYPEFDFVLPLSKYKGRSELGVYMNEKNEFSGLYPFDYDFDYVAWLNGKNFKRR